MNEPLACWAGLLIAFFYAWVQTTYLKDTCGKLRPAFLRQCLEWHVLTFIFLLVFFARTFYDILKFDVLAYHLLDFDKFQANLAMIPTCMRPKAYDELNVESGHNIVLPTFLRFISLLAPVAGFVAFIMASWQVLRYMCATKSDNSSKNQMRLVLVGMPLVFIVMALRANIRIWAIMTGSAWVPYATFNTDCKGAGGAGPTWEAVKQIEVATYRQDLEVAAGFQFMAVGIFGMVVTHALKSQLRLEHDGDSDKLVSVSVLGIWAFVGLGVVKTVVNITCHVLSVIYAKDTSTVDTVDNINVAFLDKMNGIFLLATVLSVVNMILLGRMQTVKDQLGNINNKFNATRVLLLIGQGQQLLLSNLTNTSPGYTKILGYLHKTKFLESVHWSFSDYQALLLNSSLLCFECLAVVVVNSYVWSEAGANTFSGESIGAIKNIISTQRGNAEPLLDGKKGANNAAEILL